MDALFFMGNEKTTFFGAAFFVLALVVAVRGQSIAYLDPSNGSLPAWNGSCSATWCNTTSPCSAAANTTADSTCSGVTFVSGSVLSGFTINAASSAAPLIFRTADTTVQMGTKNVTLNGAQLAAFAGTGLFQLNLNSSGHFIAFLQGTNSVATLKYTSGPGAIFVPVPTSGSSNTPGFSFGSSLTSTNPSMLFPIGLAGGLAIVGTADWKKRSFYALYRR